MNNGRFSLEHVDKELCNETYAIIFQQGNDRLAFSKSRQRIIKGSCLPTYFSVKRHLKYNNELEWKCHHGALDNAWEKNTQIQLTNKPTTQRCPCRHAREIETNTMIEKNHKIHIINNYSKKNKDHKITLSFRPRDPINSFLST